MNEQPVGLRERKKQERRAAIVRSATALFRRRGFEATAMEEIAAVADVSPGTVYNVFATKIDILAEIQLTEITSRMARKLARAGAPSTDPRKGMFALIELQMAVLSSLNRDDVKRVMANALLAGQGTVAAQAYAASDDFLRGEILERLKGYQAQKKLPGAANVEHLALLIFTAINGLFFDWLADDRMTPKQVMATVGDFLAVLPLTSQYQP